MNLKTRLEYGKKQDALFPPQENGVKQLIRYFENNDLYKPPRPKKQQSRPQPIPVQELRLRKKVKL